MKILKWLLYIVLVLAALVLIVPLFLPSTVQVSAEQDVEVSPEQAFHNLASYTDRNAWDPWLEAEPEAEFAIRSEPGYAGSEFTWDGKKIKSGRIVVDSVVFGKTIASLIYFGKVTSPDRVEWDLEKTETGTHLRWIFTAKAAYPVERLMYSLFKGGLQKDLQKGLDNLKTYLEENPPSLSSLGKIEQGKVGPMYALVTGASGTMDQFGEQMSELFPKLAAEVGKQGLEISGPPFCDYLSYDEKTGIARYLCGIPVATPGKNAGDVRVRSYREIPVIQAVHTGPYEDLADSYNALMEYIDSNGIEVTMEAFEFYLTDPATEPMVTQWQTLIAMPLK